MSTQPSAQSTSLTGECASCHRQRISIVKATGLLWRHGPRDHPCEGSGKLPVQHSITATTRSSQSTHQPPPALDDTSADLFASFSQPSEAVSLEHPSAGRPILKHVPKGARIAAASLLTQLIRDLLKDFQRSERWVRLFGFASACFARPCRGGKSHNLTSLVIRQIHQFEAGGVVERGTLVRRSRVRRRRAINVWRVARQRS